MLPDFSGGLGDVRCVERLADEHVQVDQHNPSVVNPSDGSADGAYTRIIIEGDADRRIDDRFIGGGAGGKRGGQGPGVVPGPAARCLLPHG